MRNLWHITYVKTMISADFQICISVRLSKQECQNELLKNIDLNISIVVESKVEPSSDKCMLDKMFETSSSFYIKRYQLP